MHTMDIKIHLLEQLFMSSVHKINYLKTVLTTAWFDLEM